MIKLATVFSGIGAIEHALERMGLDTEIVFACDNGDVELDVKKTDNNISRMKDSLDELDREIELINNLEVDNDIDYFEILKTMKKGADESYVELVDKIQNAFPKDVEIGDVKKEAISITDAQIKNNKGVKRNKYKYLKDNICGEDINIKYSIIRLLAFLDEDAYEYDEYNPLKKVADNIDRTELKKIFKSGKDVKERIDMLYDKYFYLKTTKKLAEMDTYDEKKQYVDNLYKGKEKSNKVKKSYLANYKMDPNHFHWNVAFLDGKYYKDKVDLFVGGSPCQSFSLVGKQRGLEDTRGTLFYEYARLIGEIQPKVFIYENVKAILSNDNGKTWEKMKEVFDGLGYNVFYKIGDNYSVLNAKDYGIPQNRERMFVVGFKKDIELEKEFEFPKPIKLQSKMQDFLIENVAGRYYLPRKGVDFVTNPKNLEKRYTQIDGEIALCQKKNQQFNWHGDFVFVEENKDMEKTMEELDKYFLSEKVVKYVLSSGTKNFYCRPETDLEVARPLLTTMHKMHRAGVDNYVHTNGRLRKLTPRECLRLMGFCDSFKIEVSDTAMYQQAGNSIVVDVLVNIMKSILTSYPELDS